MAELTSVATVQAYLGDTSISSSLLTTFIDAAEASIARYCGRCDTPSGNHWLTHTRIEFLDGEWSASAMLKFTPITAVSAVSIILGNASTQTVALTNLTMDGKEITDLSASNPGLIGKLGWRYGTSASVFNFEYGLPYPGQYDLGVYGTWGAFGGGFKRVKAEYTGGFASAPADLALAATMLSAEAYRDRTLNPSLQSERLGDYQYVRAQADQAAEAKLCSVESMIKRHRRETF